MVRCGFYRFDPRPSRPDPWGRRALLSPPHPPYRSSIASARSGSCAPPSTPRSAGAAASCCSAASRGSARPAWRACSPTRPSRAACRCGGDAAGRTARRRRSGRGTRRSGAGSIRSATKPSPPRPAPGAPSWRTCSRCCAIGCPSSRRARAGKSDGARFRLFDIVSRFLAAVARPAGLVVVLDDVHWADRPSLKLLEFVAADLADTRLLVVATYRDTEVRREDPFSATLSRLAREPSTRRLLVGGLSAAHCARWIAWRRRGATPRRSAKRCTARRTAIRSSSARSSTSWRPRRIRDGLGCAARAARRARGDRAAPGPARRRLPRDARRRGALRRHDRRGDAGRRPRRHAAGRPPRARRARPHPGRGRGPAGTVRLRARAHPAGPGRRAAAVDAQHLARPHRDRARAACDGVRRGDDGARPPPRRRRHARGAAQGVRLRLPGRRAGGARPRLGGGGAALRDRARRRRALGAARRQASDRAAARAGARAARRGRRPGRARALRGGDGGLPPDARPRGVRARGADLRRTDAGVGPDRAGRARGPRGSLPTAPALDDALRARLYARLAGDLIAANEVEQGERIFALCDEAAAAARRAGARRARHRPRGHLLRGGHGHARRRAGRRPCPAPRRSSRRRRRAGSTSTPPRSATCAP